MKILTRVDREGVPTLVQHWHYTAAAAFEVHTFEGNIHLLDIWTVRENMDSERRNWSEIADSFAIDIYVSKWWTFIRRRQAPTLRVIK